MHLLITYLATRPLLNLASLERAINCAPRTIQNAMQHHRDAQKGRPLPDRWILPIIRALCADSGSIVLNGWTIRNDDPSTGFLLEMPIPDKKATSKEIADDDGFYYYMEYSVPMYREYMDGFGFLTWLKGYE